MSDDHSLYVGHTTTGPESSSTTSSGSTPGTIAGTADGITTDRSYSGSAGASRHQSRRRPHRGSPPRGSRSWIRHPHNLSETRSSLTSSAAPEYLPSHHFREGGVRDQQLDHFNHHLASSNHHHHKNGPPPSRHQEAVAAGHRLDIHLEHLQGDLEHERITKDQKFKLFKKNMDSLRELVQEIQADDWKYSENAEGNMMGNSDQLMSEYFTKMDAWGPNKS